jgi:hypothetical protein
VRAHVEETVNHAVEATHLGGHTCGLETIDVRLPLRRVAGSNSAVTTTAGASPERSLARIGQSRGSPFSSESAA